MSQREDAIADVQAVRAIPYEGTMEQILRYEKSARKQFDWALRKLLDSQARRRKSQADVA